MCISTLEVVGTTIKNKWVPTKKKNKWFGNQLMKNGAWTSRVYACVDLVFNLSDNIRYIYMLLYNLSFLGGVTMNTTRCCFQCQLVRNDPFHG